MTNRPILVTGGGTGGHVIPTRPVIQRFLEQGRVIVYVGSKGGIEESLIDDLGITFESISTGKLRRYFSWQNVVDVFRVLKGILQAWRIMRIHRPTVVFSKGGYVAFPVVFAAWFNRVPSVAHESDLSPGLANRLCLPFVKTLCITFEETRVQNIPVVLTGTPIRDELRSGDASRAREWLSFDESKPTLLIVGGSLGASALNQIVRETITQLMNTYQIIHVCGRGNTDSTYGEMPNYRQFEYVREQWPDVLALADIVVSRAGANSVYEFLALAKPSVLIPLPLNQSRGDQIENAEMCERNGWSVMLAEERLSSEKLIQALQLIESDRAGYAERLRNFVDRNSADLICRVLSESEKTT